VLPEVVTLDELGLARLEAVLLGLLEPDALPLADRYLDSEGTPVAERDADGILRLLRPSHWPPPTQQPGSVTIAAAGQLPKAPLPDDVTLLLPTGGIRADDTRQRDWADKWRAAATTVVEVPLPPDEVANHTPALLERYASSAQQLARIDTAPQPAGHGRTVFFTGLSGSGKSTIARALADRISGSRTTTLLDGDVVRTHLSAGLTFSREDRDINIRRIGWVAAEITKHGGLAICAPIAPYDETRRWVRHQVERAAGPGAFLLVYVATPLAVCEQRDTKGLYARARAGQLTNFTGIDDPYEPPNDADLVIDTSLVTVDEAAHRIEQLLGE
jgi:sulfate adenylyltransferase